MTQTSPRIFILTFISFLALGLAACGDMDAEADPRLQVGSSPEGRILFAADGDIHVWDGSTERLTDFGDASSPAWSADGEQYLFVRTGDAYSDLLVANFGTGDARRLTGNQPDFVPGTHDYVTQVAWALDPVWSPSGSGIAYVSDDATQGSSQRKNFLWHRPSLTDDPWRVPCSTRHNDNVERPDFSPDGTQVVFAQRTSSQSDFQRWMEIRVCDLNSGELVDLVTGEPDDIAFFPRWSPDGEWIAFVRNYQGQSDIWVVPAEGGDPVRLTEEGDVTAPEWSPNGNHIAFFDPDGASFRAAYIEFEVDSNGNPSASSPSELFSEDGIDAPSGLSWIE